MKGSTSQMSWMNKCALSLVVLSMSGAAALAQSRTISGTIVDDLGEPILGANVVIVGTTTGVTTDLEGKFTISNVPENAQLKVSFIGYAQQIVSVAGTNKFQITLKEDVAKLDDVVVIGYGTVKRRDLTGSVASISGDNLKANPVSNVAQALQGQLPGISVTSQDGRPGASMSIKVRGGNSITQSNDPLFIVDGVQVSSIDDIPSDNIESMDVLKDAASTAIYGARGANGVILITTKGAKEGRAVVKYGVYFQSKWNPELIETQTAQQMVYNTWAYATAYGEKYGEDVAKYYGLGSANGNHYADYANVSAHNYVEDLMQTANSWNHDVSVSGGNDKTKIYASLNYTDDDGIRINSGFKRGGLNFKIDQKINRRVSIDFDLRYTKTETIGNNFDYATKAFTYKPIDEPLGSGDPSDLGMGSGNVEDADNPYTAVKQYKYNSKKIRVRAKSGLSWEVCKGLKYRMELSLSRNWTESKTWDGGQVLGYNSAKLDKGDGYGERLANTLNYEIPGLGKNHSASILLGNELLVSKSNSSRWTGRNFPSEWDMSNAFGSLTMTDKTNDSYTNTIGVPKKTVSFFGRMNYSYKGRYIVTGTFRADGSSNFAPNNRWGYFPAGALAWRLSDEGFMEDAQDWLDNLKLRLSIGQSGSDGIDSNLWKETWKTSSVTVDGNSVTTYVPGEMKANEDLKWETTISRNLGLDYSFMKGRVRGNVDVYFNTTKDILMKVPTDASSGYDYQYQNVGETSNKGFEVSAICDVVRSKDFNLSVNLNYNFNNNNVEKLNENALADTHTTWGSTMRMPYYDYIIRIGEPVGTIQGYVSKGYFKPEDFTVNAEGKWQLKENVKGVTTAGNYPSALTKNAADGKIFPGAPKFADEDGDGEADEKIIGHTQAHHNGGININGNYKAIDFAIGFTYQIGGKVYNANAMAAFKGDKDTSFGANRLKYAGQSFKSYGIDANGDIYLETDLDKLAAMNKGTKYGTIMSEYGICSSEFIEDASYLRLNTLTIGYTLPKSWMSKIGVNNARLYVTGGNLFCLSGYSGLDPDVNTTSSVSGFPTPNYDYNAYPKARTFTVGANITF